MLTGITRQPLSYSGVHGQKEMLTRLSRQHAHELECQSQRVILLPHYLP
jgi:hypothetical protein